jgi:tetratricopeptide (TPR) repeat protein
VYDSLAEAYMKAGEKEQAIEFYKKSLEKDPENDNAKQKIKELESKAESTQ